MVANTTAVIRLSLNSDAVDRDAKALAESLKRTLGSIKINSKLIDLGNAPDEITRLTASIKQLQSASADPKAAAQLQKEAQILQEQLRYKKELAAIEGAGFGTEDAANARALAAELSKLNLQKIASDFDKLGNAAATAAAKAKAIENSSQNTSALATSLNRSFTAAQQFAGGLGLTAQKANEAIAKLRELDTVGATNAQKFAVLNKELGITQQQFGSLNSAALQTREGLTAVAGGAAAIAAGIAGVFVKGTQEFLAFDNAIRQSGVISGSLGTPQFEALRAEVERLGIATTKTPAQIAEMSISLSRAGFTAEETSVALAGIVQASEATGENLEVVGDIISRTVRTFSKDIGETQDVADLLVQTANSTNTSVRSLGESLSYVGTSAATSNQPLDDTLILLGLLGDVGLTGSAAGTTLAETIERLKIASAGAETEFSGLVRGSAKASQAFNVIGASARNTDGSMKSVLEILPEIKANLAGLSQVDRDVVTKALFGTQGARTVNAFLAATPERIAAVTEEVKNYSGASANASEELRQGLGGAINLFTGSLSAAATEAGQFVAVGLEPVVRAATGLLNTFLGLPAPIQGFILATTALTGAIAAAVAVIATYQLLNIQLLAVQAAETLAMIATTIATKGATSAQLLFNTQISITQARLIATRAALAVGAIAKLAFAAATGGAAGAMGAFAASLAAVAPLLIVIAAGIAGIKFAQYANELREANDAIAQSSTSVESASTEAFAAANRTKAATDKLNEARLSGQSVTQSELDDAKKLTEANDARLKGLQEQLKQVEAISVAGGSDEQKASQDALTQTIKTSIGALEGQNKKLKESIGLREGVTDSIESLSAGYDEQLSELERFNQQRELSATEALAAGNITEEKARADNLIAEQNYLSQRIALNESKLAELEAARGSATDAESLKKAGEEIVKVEATIAGDRLKVAQNSLAERRRLQEEEVKELAIAETEAQTAIATARASGSITDGEANIRRLAATRDRIAGELALEIKGSADKQKIAQLELQLVENAAAQQEAVEAESLNRIAKATQEANRQIEASQNERIAAVKQAQLDGVATEEEAARQIADIQRSGTGEKVQAVEDELAALRAARAAGTVDTETGAEKEAELIQQLGQLSLQRLDDELAARKAVQEEAIAAIQRELAASDRAAGRKIAGLERQVAAQQQVEASLQRQSDLLSSQASLSQALSNLDQVRSQSSVDRFSRALEIQQRLNSGEVESAQVQRALQQELSGLGVSRGASELSIIRQRQAEEDRLAAIQRVALSARQTQERASLELETRRNQLVSQRAVVESQIAEIQARQNQNTAQASLREAQVTGNADQIAAAQADVELAQQSTDLAGQSRLIAQENATAQAAIATNANAALLAQQAAELVQTRAAEQARQYAQALAAAEASSAGIARNLSGGTPQARRDGGGVKAGAPYLVGEAGPELITPRRSGWVWTAQQTAEMLKASVPKSFTGGVAIAPASNPTLPLLKEIRGLRADLKALDRPQQNNNFTLVNEEDPYDKVVKTASALLRGRIQSLGL